MEKKNRLSYEQRQLSRLRLSALKEWRDSEAKALNLDPAIFFPSAILENLAAVDLTKGELPSMPGFSSIRKNLYSDQILKILQEVINISNCRSCEGAFLLKQLRVICPLCDARYHLACVMTRTNSEIDLSSISFICINCREILKS